MSSLSTVTRTPSSETRALITTRRKSPSVNRKLLWRTALGFVIAAVLLFPIYWMVNASLQPAGNTLQNANWFPLTPDFSGYGRAWEDQSGSLLISVIVALGSVVVSLAIATPAAYALAQLKIRGVNVVLFGILISQMIPGIVIANSLYGTYNEFGMLNTIGGLILADASHGIPFAILVMRAFMESIPKEIIEAARVDGAGPFRAFVSIAVPVSRNALITGGLFTFLFSWSDFIFALTLTTSEAAQPITLGIYRYMSSHTNDWSAIMATAVLASIPAAILLIAAQKYIAAGVTGGAVK